MSADRGISSLTIWSGIWVKIAFFNEKLAFDTDFLSFAACIVLVFFLAFLLLVSLKSQARDVNSRETFSSKIGEHGLCSNN